MPWFKIDDGFHCHPKVFAAGTPAIGLYVRCGSWAAQQATDGVIPKQIARLYGTPRMIKALVDAGLWHQKGHGCQSCPELDANSFVIHQYLERNPSRVDVELARKSKSERQQRWREGKKKAQVNEGSTPDVDGDVDASTRRHGDAAPNPSRPIPSPSPPTEEKTASYARSREDASPGIPEASRPLVAALQQQQLHVGWELAPTEWFQIEALIKRCGITALVASARASWQGAKSQPRSARYFLPGWKALPEAPAELPAGAGGSVVPFPGPSQHRPSTTDQRVNAALEAGRRLQQLANARKDQQ